MGPHSKNFWKDAASQPASGGQYGVSYKRCVPILLTLSLMLVSEPYPVQWCTVNKENAENLKRYGSREARPSLLRSASDENPARA
jgi:hypothetical protein